MLLTMKHKKKCLEKEALKRASKALSPDADIPVVKDAPRQQKINLQIAEASLPGDLSRLSDMDDIAKKIALKKSELIPKYWPLVNDAIKSGTVVKSELFFCIALWMLDADMTEEALPVCDFVIQHAIPPLERFKSNPATTFAECIFNWAEAQYKLGHSADPYFSQLIERLENQQWVTHMITHSKCVKLAAMYCEMNDDFSGAKHFYQRCIAINPEKHGVKTRLEKVVAKLKSQEPSL